MKKIILKSRLIEQKISYLNHCYILGFLFEQFTVIHELHLNSVINHTHTLKTILTIEMPCLLFPKLLII